MKSVYDMLLFRCILCLFPNVRERLTAAAEGGAPEITLTRPSQDGGADIELVELV